MFGGTIAMFVSFLLPATPYTTDAAIGIGIAVTFMLLTVFRLWLTHSPAMTRMGAYNGIDGEGDKDFLRAPDPRTAVRRARVEFLGSWAVATAVVTPAATALRGVEYGLAAGSVLGLLAAVQFSAWPYYAGARVALAWQGRLPWRLVPFLEDAHRRGVLRQSGAVLQFRHLMLQEHLAALLPIRPVEWSDGPNRRRGRGSR